MKLLLISAVYPPEPEPSAVMARQLMEQLAKDGHQVTVLAPFPNRPGGTLYAGYRRALRLTESANGVRVVRCATWFIGPRRRVRDRVLENFAFGLSSLLNGLRETRPDIVLLESWPLFATTLGVVLAKIWRRPVLNYVKDVYPEALEAFGVIGPRTASILRFWDAWICRNSQRVIAISETMREILIGTRGLAKTAVLNIPDWIDSSEFGTGVDGGCWRTARGIPAGAFLALFAGTMGLVSGVDVLVQVAQQLKARTDILILCVGQGLLKEKMLTEAASLGLTNLRFEPFQARACVPEMMAAADVTLLTITPGYPDSSVPSKLVTYLAAGRPVICAARSTSAVARAIEDSEAGVVAEPGCAKAIAEAIGQLADRPHENVAMGERARLYFEQNFTFERAYQQWLTAIRISGRGTTYDQK